MPLLTDRLNFGNIYFRDKTYTPDTVSRSIDAVSDRLNKRSVSNSPFVYLFAPNHIKMVYALFGIIKSGRICVLVDPAIGRLELVEMMADTVPGALIRIDKTTDAFDFEKEFEFRDCRLEEKRLEGLEDVCLMLYTNASDGFAKAAMLTNESLFANAKAGMLANKVTTGAISCALISYCHLFALQTGIFIPSLSKTSIFIVELEEFLKIKIIADQINKLSVSHIYSIPAIFYPLGKFYKTKGFPTTLRSCVCGGVPLSDKIFNLFKSNFNIEIQIGYGLTEASPICTFHYPGDKVKQGSVGRALPCCEVRIFDLRDQVLPIGQVGEICIKGMNVMKGYYNNPKATHLILKNGWLHSGDIGKMDEEGYLYFIECKKRMYNLGGNKVYPAELERLLKIPGNVIKATVECEPDELLYNILRVNVELNNKNENDKKKYQTWCEEYISKYKLPQKIKFV
ncbi:MAG TPA: AMP-binding protein [Chitinivibrionales bacterium]|nr:AMP-binding protein [Chitinivibrionales bacterium]